MPVPPNVPTDPPAPPGILEKPVLHHRGRKLRQPIWRACPLAGHRGQQPDAVKGGPARVKNEYGIELPIRHHAGRRYPANPTLGPLPCPNRRRIIHADGPILLDDPPSSRGDLPLQGVAGQSFTSISLPHVAPEIFRAFGALTRSGSARPCSRVRPTSWEDDHSRIRGGDRFDTPSLQAER